MGWIDLKKPKPIGNSNYEGASIALVLGRGRAKYSIALDGAALPKGWKRGTIVSVQIGAGEHSRKLRIARSGAGTFLLGTVGKHARAFILYVPTPAGVEPRVHDREQVAITQDGTEAVILDLPDWAMPKLPKAETRAPRPTDVYGATRRVDVAGSLMGDPKPGRRAWARR